MSREAHVRFCESRGVRFPPATHLVVLCANRARAEQALRQVSAILATLGLRLHPDKTKIVRLTGGEQGFDFLGFHHHKVASWKYRGRYYLQRWPSDRAMASIRAKVRAATDRRFVGRDIDAVVKDLNPVLLRGWGNYFAGATRRASSPVSTPTSTNGWPCSPAPSTVFGAATGSGASPTPGCSASASTA